MRGRWLAGGGWLVGAGAAGAAGLPVRVRGAAGDAVAPGGSADVGGGAAAVDGDADGGGVVGGAAPHVPMAWERSGLRGHGLQPATTTGRCAPQPRARQRPT